MLVQNSHDPKQWDTYETLQAGHMLTMHAELSEDQTVSSSSQKQIAGRVCWSAEMEQSVTIRGSAAVTFEAAVAEGSAEDSLVVTAALIDTSEEPFPVFGKEEGCFEVAKEIVGEAACWQGAPLPWLDLVRLKTRETDRKVIAEGWIDLCNPESGYDSASAEASIMPVIGEDHTYTVYLQPEVYQVQAGHELVLILAAYDPECGPVREPYSFVVRKESVSAEIPCEEGGSAWMKLSPQENHGLLQ